MFHRVSKQRGFSLVEMAVVLAIIGVIIAAIWVSIGRINANRKVNSAVQQVHKLVENVRSLYSARPSTAGMTIKYLVESGAVPSDMKTSDVNRIVNPWGGSADLVPFNLGKEFTIQFYGVPKDACIKTAMETLKYAQEMKLVSLQLGSTKVYPTTDPTQQVTLKAASDACFHASSSNNLIWIYTLRR